MYWFTLIPIALCIEHRATTLRCNLQFLCQKCLPSLFDMEELLVTCKNGLVQVRRPMDTVLITMGMCCYHTQQKYSTINWVSCHHIVSGSTLSSEWKKRVLLYQLLYHTVHICGNLAAALYTWVVTMAHVWTTISCLFHNKVLFIWHSYIRIYIQKHSKYEDFWIMLHRNMFHLLLTVLYIQ